MVRHALWVWVAGCGGSPPSDDGTPSPDADADGDADTDSDADGDADADSDADADTGPIVDLDLDGLDDAEEQALAEGYFPYVAVSPDEDCPTMGVVFRAKPHTLDPTKVHVVWVLLWDIDCGADGHVGDDEVVAASLDPAVPPPGGILTLRAIAHQDTLCGHVTDCGCGQTPCVTAPWDGADWPVVFSSEDKHGNYLFEADCDGACFFTNRCDPAPAPATPLFVNAGEPDAPLTDDLTAAGLITAENGWVSPELFGYDPWSGADFGSAGNVASDLDDPAFNTPLCGP